MLTRKITIGMVFSCALSFVSLASNLPAQEGPANPNYAPLADQNFGPASAPATR